MTQKLKRYEMYEPNHFVDEYIQPSMVESESGDYVTYEDYQKLQDQLEKAEAKKHDMIQYCMKHEQFQFMWAATILSILFECDFRDSYNQARQYFKEKENND